MQQIQNYAAQVILHISESSNITTHLKSLHWLPLKVRSTYKIACLYYHCHSSTAPSYVADIKSHHTLAPAHTPCLFSIDLHTVRQHLVIVHFILLLLSGTLFQMMSGVPYHCRRFNLVWRHTCFIQFARTELFLWSLCICAWFGLVIVTIYCYCLVDSLLGNALMCIEK